MNGKPTTRCEGAERYIVHRADGSLVTSPFDTVAHVEGCARCQAELTAHRAVSRLLAMRPADVVAEEFAASLGRRLDESEGWFGVIDWKAWTLRLGPIAAALTCFVFVARGAAPTSPPPSLGQWLRLSDTSSPAAILWQPDVPADSIVEALLTNAPDLGGGR